MSQLSTIQTLQRVGPASGSDGSFQFPRAGKEADEIVSQLKGKYAEASARGQLFSATAGASGVAPGTALGTTGALILHNPAKNKVRLEVVAVASGYISGTLGAGTLFHCGLGTQGNTAVSGGTALTAQSLDIGGGYTSQAVVNAGGTIAATPTALYPFCQFGAALASTAIGESTVFEDVDGRINVEPGGVYCLEAVAAAGTSPLIAPAVVWREVPLLTG